MKKLLCLIACVFVSHIACAENVPAKDIADKGTTCIDGITYFVGVSFDGQWGFKHQFIASVKIDPKTMQPQLCKS